MSTDNLKYSKEHEWVRLEGDTAVVGITAYAAESLGDVVYVDLPTPGKSFNQFEKFGEVESVKAVSDLFLPVSGEVIEANPDLEGKPEQVNEAPYEGGWLVKVKLKNPAELETLMDGEAYKQFTAD